MSKKRSKRSKVIGQSNKVNFSLLLNKKIFCVPTSIFFLPFGLATPFNGVSPAAFAQTPPSPTPVRVVVNSNLDGAIAADAQLTLREAIEVVNGTLTPQQLSSAEQVQVTPASGGSSIEFNLPSGATTIELQTVLPDLAAPGLTIDGTTQPGYDPNTSATAEIAIPVPLVTIKPATGQEVFRGLTVVADNITIRGLNMYGFNAEPIKQQLGSALIYDGKPEPATLTTPPGDIVIAHRLPPPDISQQKPPASNFPFRERDVPPKNIVIENNWLGITTDERMPEKISAFGVYLFNSQGATIRKNRISYHAGSAIITSVRAENTKVEQNIIIGNGIDGMPDALRFEGVVDNSQILGNLICANDGAGVYLFKPQGKILVQNNKITYNGRRLRRAAVFVMGSDHQVIGNEIDHQAGPGVVVTAFPRNDIGKREVAIRNEIRNNKFAALEGLSIDLNSQGNLGVIDFQRGDGPNPRRDSSNRRKETGNAAINAPEFAEKAFATSGSSATVTGKADKGSEITIYRLGDYQRGKEAIYQPGFGALTEPLTIVSAGEDGKFTAQLENVQSGDVISAIATDPKYGTSEPAVATMIGVEGTIPNVNVQPKVDRINPPQCVSKPTPPPPPEPPPQPPIPPEAPPEPIRIQVPRNVHFALDKSFISDESAQVLDKVAEVLKQYPFIVIELQGHTDPRASDAYNQALGKRRALSTRNYLLQKGIAPERMTIRSFGESQLKVPGSTDIVDYARDRRTEIIFKDVRGIDLIVEDQEQDLQIERRR
ncbi:OmpA family protein [Rivularia sp. UHCC 0363]|uniref:OmpA family protein n=1 Tax=Rivularia sp. UHCC 0363 TaxID=3110244 RepID=UPI002B20D412|nr:OmpA family protein [Rivularia sp. UHCC 0363]MEA5598053.1 OmpA family protein [Rivularia sp. UHCC 0363]